MRRGIFVLLAIFFLSANVAAQTLPRAEPVPGGIAVIQLTPATAPPPRAFLNKERVMVIRQRNDWYAVVGLPQSLLPGQHHLTTIEPSNQTVLYEFTVKPKEYGVQRITLKDKRLVEPNADDLERITREQQAIQAAYTQWIDVETPPLSFDFPVHGRLTGVFGTRRIFNGHERQPHSGIDIAAPRGAAIVAPADGLVTGTGDYFFNGLTVFVDHGQGLVSMFNHLDRVAVEPGTKVKRGQLLGDIGSTGRATGPHLHWSVSLNNVRVDPLLFVRKDAVKRLALEGK